VHEEESLDFESILDGKDEFTEKVVAGPYGSVRVLFTQTKDS